VVSSDDDDFERGDNQIIKKDDIDLEDDAGFEKIVKNDLVGIQTPIKEQDEQEEMTLQ